jgi:hypothetical protein
VPTAVPSLHNGDAGAHRFDPGAWRPPLGRSRRGAAAARRLSPTRRPCTRRDRAGPRRGSVDAGRGERPLPAQVGRTADLLSPRLAGMPHRPSYREDRRTSRRPCRP